MGEIDPLELNRNTWYHTKWWLPETNGQVHLPRKQRLVYQKWINVRLVKVRTAINWISVIWNSDLSNEIKRIFFLAAVVSVLLYGYNTWRWLSARRKSLTAIAQMQRAIIKKIPEPTSHKIAVWPPTTHLKDHPN